ncbi:MAG: 7-carboxy-7-deazaguanine synthase [Pseudomonadota bacterium]|nr:7-carboxy-7-deazaguanine synthase [Pseudomonadota bacterium]
MYKIKEIFRSIQGEGFYSGKDAVFIRFSGCNFWNGLQKDKKKAICNFCDTDFRGVDGNYGGNYDIKNLMITVENIWKSSFSLEKKYVVLTGGEPLLQVDEELVRCLKNRGYTVAVETNGSIRTKINFDWICVSPKNNNNWELKKGDELKIVYPQNIFDLKKLLVLDFKYFFLQPKDDEFSKLNINKTLNYCKAHKPWFPSFQIHKVIGIN